MNVRQISGLVQTTIVHIPQAQLRRRCRCEYTCCHKNHQSHVAAINQLARGCASLVLWDGCLPELFALGCQVRPRS